MNKKYAAYAESPLRKLMAVTPINGAFILHEDQKLLTFSSCDHLALTDNPCVKKNAIKYVLQQGICPFSQAADFYLTCQQDLEKKLAELLRRESAFFFSSRSEANQVTLSALGLAKSTIFIDEKCHPSLQKGAESSRARIVRYTHVEQLEQLLDHTATSIIVTESIFSQDGAIADLPRIAEIADHFQALLFVDDSHAFGISGVDGMGLCAHLPEVDIISGSFGKACGAYGGYIACKETIRDYLINTAIASTLFSPPIIGAIEAALDLIPQMEGERKQLEQRSHWLKRTLREMSFELPKFNTPLVSMDMKSEDECERLKTYLMQEQILVNSRNGSIKLALNVCHMPDHLTRLTDAIKSWQMAGIIAN